MERHLIVVAGTAALALFAVSPSLAEHGKRQSLNVKNADRVQRTANHGSIKSPEARCNFRAVP